MRLAKPTWVLPPATARQIFIRGEVVETGSRIQLLRPSFAAQAPSLRNWGLEPGSGGVESPRLPPRTSSSRASTSEFSLGALHAYSHSHLSGIPCHGACAVAALSVSPSHRPDGLPGGRVAPGRPHPCPARTSWLIAALRSDAPASVVWDVLGHVFEPEDESTIIDIEDEDHILMRVAPPAAPEDEASGTCVIALLPCLPRARFCISVSATRRRDATALAWAGVAAESLSSLSMLRDLRDACVGGLLDA